MADSKDPSAVKPAPSGVLEATGETATVADVLSILGALYLFVGLLWFKSVSMVCAAIVLCAASAAMGAALLAPRQWLLLAVFAVYGLFQLQFMAGAEKIAAAAAAAAAAAGSASA